MDQHSGRAVSVSPFEGEAGPRDPVIREDVPFTWMLRDVLSITGTRFGCGTGPCDGCTIFIDGQLTPSCTTPVCAAVRKRVTMIELVRRCALTPSARFRLPR